ncbi:hypothetical protein GCM10025868_15860 [Angustibacter aerolatus]|uniref:Uncharacterized protein n=1 Tax=Angustibacter aerolatus TaxID=1162965 RepID=A0ABQ6JDS2_9ACTN|nr:hypothetical protein GCM10025868_15860 [Angustibacter aerolatus]
MALAIIRRSRRPPPRNMPVTANTASSRVADGATSSANAVDIGTPTVSASGRAASAQASAVMVTTPPSMSSAA